MPIELTVVGSINLDAFAEEALTGLRQSGVYAAPARPVRVVPDLLVVNRLEQEVEACLVVSLLEGRARAESLRRACAAGALAASLPAAQPSLPTAAEVEAALAA